MYKNGILFVTLSKCNEIWYCFETKREKCFCSIFRLCNAVDVNIQTYFLLTDVIYLSYKCYFIYDILCLCVIFVGIYECEVESIVLQLHIWGWDTRAYCYLWLGSGREITSFIISKKLKRYMPQVPGWKTRIQFSFMMYRMIDIWRGMKGW